MSDEVKFEERGGELARVTLARPARRNALTRAMVERLAEIFAAIATRRDLRAVVLCGEGETFCAGTDIEELSSLDEEGARRAAERGQRVCELIETCGAAVVAAVQGAASGGGCELVLACHMRVAATDARFTLPELRLGVIPGYGGTQRLARETSRPRALAAMLAGEGLDADEALRRGLVNRVVAPGEVLSEAEGLARRVVEYSAPLAARACLEAVTRGPRLRHDEALALEAELFSRLFASADVREGTRAFLEKRRPVFKGE
ncbi:MAG TPA: enoyl-CoA hydratase-related protein [Pyrinomonadaceae bacterium]|nr:enoyl-CoA hydratase-related protein [Pyrinomonadaceae bacterium]